MKEDYKTVQRSSLNRRAISLAALLITLALIITYITYLTIRVAGLEINSATDILRTKQDVSRLQFCTDRQIRPCDDLSLATWNNAHPEDQFQTQL